MTMPSGKREQVKFMLVGPNGELHETRVNLPDLDELRPGDEVAAEDPAFGFKLYFLVRCMERPEADDPRYEEAETWVYLEMAR